MVTPEPRRSVSMSRVGPAQFRAVNVRGGELAIGNGSTTDFSPVELLLAAIGGCSGLDVEALTSRRAEAADFSVIVEADKIRDGEGNRLTDLVMTFRVSFPAGAQGDAARKLLPDAVAKSHDRLCVVSRTVELSTPVGVRIED
jgi:putative redox protein